MNATRRLSIAALFVACLHLVFGAIVRISGSGMGCGDHWPKCYGYWFPPFNRPDLIVEVSHRYLASILTLTVLSMALVAWRNRRVVGVGGKGGAMRSAFGAVAAVFSAAILGGVTVKMGNAPWATVAHWLVAMTLLAMVATTAIRSGALGGASSLVQRGTQRARRSGFAAAVLAIFAVALGGLTAKYPGAAVGCTTVPMCGPNPSVATAGVHVQITHRTLAVLLVLHLIGVVMMVRKRRAEEAPVVFKAAHVALGMVLLQLVVASSMVLFHLPPVLRSLHEATGVGIWLSCFTLAYLARRASNVTPPEPATLPDPSPKGDITLTREPVTVAAAVASMEAPDTRLSVNDARDVSVAQRIVENCVVVAAEASAPSDEALPPALMLVAEADIVEPEPVVILSEAKAPLAAEEIAAVEAIMVAEAPAVVEELPGVEELPPPLTIVAEAKIVEPKLEPVVEQEPGPVVILSEAKDPLAAEEILEIATEERGPSVAALPQDDVALEDVVVIEDVLAIEDEAIAANAAADEAVILAELILAMEDAAKEAALDRAEALAVEAALAAAIASEAQASAVILSEANDLPVIEEVVEIAEAGRGPSVAALPQDDAVEAALLQDDAAEAVLPQDDVVEELDWEPRRAEAEELDEFSIAALEAEVAVLEAAQVEEVVPTVVEATVAEPEPVVIVEEPAAVSSAEPVEQVAAEASVVAPPVKAPKLSPLTAPTMAVLVARGADFL